MSYLPGQVSNVDETICDIQRSQRAPDCELGLALSHSTHPHVYLLIHCFGRFHETIWIRCRLYRELGGQDLHDILVFHRAVSSYFLKGPYSILNVNREIPQRVVHLGPLGADVQTRVADGTGEHHRPQAGQRIRLCIQREKLRQHRPPRIPDDKNTRSDSNARSMPGAPRGSSTRPLAAKDTPPRRTTENDDDDDALMIDLPHPA
jgi:hypothetical protein